MRYNVKLYYTGFVSKMVEANSEQEAIKIARKEHDAPRNLSHFIERVSPIIDTLEPWLDADEAILV